MPISRPVVETLKKLPGVRGSHALRVAYRAVRNALHRSFTGRTYAAKHLERAFHEKTDPWQFGTSPADVERFQKTWALIPDASYQRILEIGCAEGYFTYQIASRFPAAAVLALDFVPVALERAKKRCAGHSNLTFQCLDIGTQNIAGSFDLIFCMGVLEYGPTLHEIHIIRDRIREALASGGHLLLETHLVPEELEHRWWVRRLAWGARALHDRFAATDMVVVDEAVVCEDRLASVFQKKPT